MSEERDEALLRELLGQLTDLIASSQAVPARASEGLVPSGPRTEAVKKFLRAHKDVPGFKSLAFTLILLADN